MRCFAWDSHTYPDQIPKMHVSCDIVRLNKPLPIRWLYASWQGRADTGPSTDTDTALVQFGRIWNASELGRELSTNLRDQNLIYFEFPCPERFRGILDQTLRKVTCCKVNLEGTWNSRSNGARYLEHQQPCNDNLLAFLHWWCQRDGIPIWASDWHVPGDLAAFRV